MQEIRKEDLTQEVFDLYDDFAHSRIERREFMLKLSTYAVGGITVAALSSFLMPAYSSSIQVMADDPHLKSEYVYYQSPKGGGIQSWREGPGTVSRRSRRDCCQQRASCRFGR